MENSKPEYGILAYRSKSVDKPNEKAVNGNGKDQLAVGNGDQLEVGAVNLQTSSPDPNNKENEMRGRSPYDANNDNSSWSDGLKTRVSRSLEKLMSGIKSKLSKDE